MKEMPLIELDSWIWIIWGLYWIVASRFVQKTKQSEGLFLRLQHVLPLFLGFLLIFNAFHRTWIFGALYDSGAARAIGTCLTAAGLLFAAWARIHLGKYWSGIITLKEDHRLIRSGPYRLVRHPIYTGFLGAAFGSALVAATGDAFFGFFMILAALARKIVREEAFLSAEFGPEYTRFKKEVSALLPFIF